MKIIFPQSYYKPEICAGIYILEDVSKACADKNIECYINVPSPCRNVPLNTKWKKKEYICGNKIYINRFKMYSEGKNPILRAFRYFLCEIVQLYYCLWVNYDLVFIDSTPPIQGLKIPIIKFFRRKPIVFNLQDIFPDSLVGTGLAKKGSLLWKIGRVVENVTYKYADMIIVISEDFKKNILAKGVPEEKIEVVYNWVDENAVKNVNREDNKLFDKYGLDRSKFFVTYSGNIGLTQNMDMLLSVAKELETEEPNIQFVLIGEGAYKKNVEEIIERDKIQNVKLLPFQPYEDISHVFSLGNVGLVISKPGVGANSVPSKTWSILSASRPVLANFDENELKSIVADNNCGIFTKAGDKEAFKESILKLYHSPETCETMGKNGRKFIMENLTREIGTSKYVKVIEEVIKANKK